MVSLLEGSEVHLSSEIIHLRDDETLEILILVKKGLKTFASLARALERDVTIIKFLLKCAISTGLVSPNHRITAAGYDFIHKRLRKDTRQFYNFGLYIPKSWCAGWTTTQPFESGVGRPQAQTDPKGLVPVGGDDGEPSLVRTDAMATSSPMMDMTKYPSWTRDRHIHHGPLG